jgi:hypothetical protein
VSAFVLASDYSNHWEARIFPADGAGTRYIAPEHCPECHRFEAALSSEPKDSLWYVRRFKMTVAYRDAHHNPKYAFVDRAAHLLERMKVEKWPVEMLRDVARFVVMAEQP